MSNNITKKGSPVHGPLTNHLKENQKAFFKAPSVKPPTAADCQSQIQEVPINIPSRINRDTEIGNLVKIVKETGGFDPRLWNPPTIARLPNGDKFLYDGDHSRALYKAFFPERETMPGRVVDINKIEEYHKLFIRSNARCKTAIKAEEIFVHEYHAQEPSAVHIANQLSNAGLSVYCSHENGGTVGCPSGMRIKIGAAKQAFKTHEVTRKAIRGRDKQYKTAVKDAVGILKTARVSISKEESLPAELLQGLVMVLGCYSTLRPGGVDHAIFQGWISQMINCNSVKQVASDLKGKGGALVNYPAWSVAKGLIKSLVEPSPPPALGGISGSYRLTTLNRIHGPSKK